MLQISPFDNNAERYDSLFTFSATGLALRKIVWKYLEREVSAGMSVLEINCGTGEDAFFLSRLGCHVLATDASSAMIAQCTHKIKVTNQQPAPSFVKAAFDELETTVGNRKFDLVFSDFSGLNCLNAAELKTTSVRLHKLLSEDGKIILVVFSKQCLWEKIYMLLKGRYNEVNRRSAGKSLTANLSGTEVPVFYYSGLELKRIFNGLFELVRKKPLGLFIPPSYLDPFFKNKRFVFRALFALEKTFGRCSSLSAFADHYIIEFRKV